MDLPVLAVTFDDGTSYEVEAKPRDLLAAERAGLSIDGGTPMAVMYAVAHAALLRMQRAGAIPDDIKLPLSADELAEVADVEGVEGKE